MSKFGWSYPPGAANDPNAPYNQEETFDNQWLSEALPDHDGLGALSRSAYRYTDCGASLGALIRLVEEPAADMDESGPAGAGYPNEVERWVYGDDLYKFGTWKEMDTRGELVLALSVGSIIEGVDQCTDTIEVDCRPNVQLEIEPGEFAQRYWKSLDDVEKQARAIWNETHGCDTCAKHFQVDPESIWYEGTPVWSECPDCRGDGIPI